jgi:hypothetical protein
MNRVRDEIHERAAAARTAKEEEVETAIEQYNTLLDEAAAARSKRTKKARQRASDLEWQADHMKVRTCEEPLPHSEAQQWAVVFELRAPSELWALRSAVYLLATAVCGCAPQRCRFQADWRNSRSLKRWLVQQRSPATVTMCSTTKRFAESHYSSAHPTHPLEQFLLPCRANVHLVSVSAPHGALPFCRERTASVAKLCTLKAVQHYKSLQWALASTVHTQNEALAKQSECPRQLALSEYCCYASLRAGERLQLRNLLRAIEMRTLRF